MRRRVADCRDSIGATRFMKRSWLLCPVRRLADYALDPAQRLAHHLVGLHTDTPFKSFPAPSSAESSSLSRLAAISNKLSRLVFFELHPQRERVGMASAALV